MSVYFISSEMGTVILINVWSDFSKNNWYGLSPAYPSWSLFKFSSLSINFVKNPKYSSMLEKYKGIENFSFLNSSKNYFFSSGIL